MLSLLMLLATGYGVLQLAVLGWATRSVRFVTLLRAVAVGFFACGFVALLLQLAAVGVLRGVTGLGWIEAVRLAGYTIDPWIEEIVKVAPIVLIALAVRRLRQQWGLTDYFLLGAAIGAGFTLAEAMLRFGHRAGAVVGTADGYTLPMGLYPPAVPGLGKLLTSWLPAPVGGYELLGLGPGEWLNLHLPWTALAAAGIGYCLRGRAGRGGGWFRLLGIIPLVYVSVDHAAHNYLAAHPNPAGPIGWFARLFGLGHELLGGLVLVGLIVVVTVDLIDLRRVRGDHPELLTERERTGSRVLALLRPAVLALPLSTWVLGRLLLVRRSLWYAIAAGAPPPADLTAEVVRSVRELDQAGDRRRWWAAARGLGRQLIGDPRRLDARTLLRRGWPLLLWLLLLLPVLLYLGLGTIPPLAGLQELLASPYVFPVLGVLAVLGVAFLGWQLIRTVTGLLAARDQPWIDPAGRSWCQVLVGAAAIGTGVGALIRWLTGAGGADRLLASGHILDALGDALLAAGLVLALSALFLYPPVAVVAVAGGGFRLLVTGLTMAAVNRLALAGVLAGAGILLSEASGSTGGGGASAARLRRLEELAKDPAIGGKVKDQTWREAEAALGLEDAGRLRGIRRDPDGFADFIDRNGQRWDVKEFHSSVPGRRGRYDLKDALDSITSSIRDRENVILRRDFLTDDAAEELAEAIAKVPDWKGRILWWP
ncbi:PrsW family glutamic-type intramembrane protease [Microlunatus speluncae]|uniref:PrsW family glutamic-type intramembrane protease n=1 Tax=Microlunatus speluncae TaxID=2594267 RepID=UPI001375D26E|nr:PrsW family glutamic-type intramembrane protease [Microlunatus speluncae]